MLKNIDFYLNIFFILKNILHPKLCLCSLVENIFSSIVPSLVLIYEDDLAISQNIFGGT